MKLTVLGCHGPYPPAGGACSGYLLADDQSLLLLDCGNGVLSKLQYYTQINNLAAVFLSHLHSDHISDLFVMRYALQMDLEQGKRKTPLNLFAPAEPAAEYDRLPYKDVFAINTIAGNASLNYDSLKFSFLQTQHPFYCCAMRIEEPGGKVIVYSGDTAFFQELIPFASAADLFLCEANFLQADLETALPHYHLSASQAASIARTAGVKKLLLTHLPPHRDANLYLDEARPFFPGVELAEEGKDYYV